MLFPDASKPTITVNITYRVGSRHEGRGESGMAHLLEHMVFKGTPTHPNVWGALEDHGASFNGTTWVDRTNYFETLPASDDNLEFAIRLESDRMINSEILAEELAKEMTVVRNEFEMGENSPSAVLGERMLSAAYLWHNYGKSTIGNRSDIERVPVANLRKFYEKYYQPDNATLVVAGQFEPAQALALIRKYFGSIRRPERTLEATYTEEPPQDGPRQVMLKRVGDVATVGLTYHIPAGSHPDYPAVAILVDVLTHQPSGALYRRLVASGLAADVSGAAFSWAEPGVVQFDATVAGEHDPQSVLAVMVDTTEGMAKGGITADQVARAVARRAKMYKMAMTDSGRIGVRLSESIALGDWRMFFITRDRFAEVTLNDVRRVADDYFVESNRTAGLFLPTEDPQRATVPLEQNVKQLASTYQGRKAVAAGEALRPDVDYIESRIERMSLPSGIDVALLPVQRRGDAVQARFRFAFGNEEALTGQDTALELLPTVMMRGTRKRSYEELRDEIDRLQSRVAVRGGSTAGEVVGSITTDRAHLGECIELLGEILKSPALDEEEFEIVKNRIRTSTEQGMSDPQTLGMIAMRRAMNPFPPSSLHYIPTLEESLERLENVSLGQLRELHQTFFGADQLDVAVVGDFDPEQVKANVEAVFGDWKTGKPYARIAKPFRAIDDRGRITIDTPDKEMAIVAMGTTVAMRDVDPRYPAMQLASYVLGRSSKSRLLNRLRHQGGLSYGAGGGFRASAQDENASLTTMAICAPQNADKALTALAEEVHRWIDDGLTEEEIGGSQE